MTMSRNSASRAMQRLGAVASQQQIRGLRMSVIEEAHRPTSDHQHQAARLEQDRQFHTSRTMNIARDTSTIDFAYMPQYELEEPTPPEIMRVPLLPENFFPPRTSHALKEAVEPVIRPQISTASFDNLHSVSAMSEVTDNHSIDLDPFDLTSKVNAAAKKMTGLPIEKLKEPGIVRELWSGMLDDLLGAKKTAKD